jgi:hypothetical protein
MRHVVGVSPVGWGQCSRRQSLGRGPTSGRQTSVLLSLEGRSKGRVWMSEVCAERSETELGGSLPQVSPWRGWGRFVTLLLICPIAGVGSEEGSFWTHGGRLWSWPRKSVQPGKLLGRVEALGSLLTYNGHGSVQDLEESFLPKNLSQPKGLMWPQNVAKAVLCDSWGLSGATLSSSLYLFSNTRSVGASYPVRYPSP